MEKTTIFVTCCSHFLGRVTHQCFVVNSSLSLKVLRTYSSEKLFDHVCEISGADYKSLKDRIQVGLRATEDNIYYLSLNATERGTFHSITTTFPEGRVVASIEPKL